MYDRGHSDEWDSLSHNYLRSNTSYGDFLRRQNMAGQEGFHNRPPMVSSEYHSPGRDGSWRGDMATPPSSNSWRHEPRGPPLLPRPDASAGPSGSSESWKKIGAAVEPLEAQRHIAPPGGFRNEMWRSGAPTPPSSNWRRDSQIPFNGIRPRDAPPTESPRDQARKRPFTDADERRSEPHAVPSKIADAKGSTPHDDNWRALPRKDQMSVVNIEKETKVQGNSQDVPERKEYIKDPEPEPNVERTEPIQKKSSIVIHNSNFEDVHLFHLPPHKRPGYSSTAGTATRPLGSEGGVPEGDRRTGLVIHDSKFEDVHMFHLKGSANGHPVGGPSPPSNESWLKQYNRRIEMNKMKSSTRPPLLSPPERPATDFRPTDPYPPRAMEEFRHDPYPRERLDPSEFSRSPAQQTSAFQRGREEMRPVVRTEVSYNRLSVEKTIPGHMPDAKKMYEDKLKEEKYFTREPRSSLLPKSEPTRPINPDDYVEEFNEDDWNEVAELVNSVPLKRPSQSSPEKMAHPVSFFRTEMPSVRSAKAPSELPAGTGGGQQTRIAPPLRPEYGASSAPQWRNEKESYSGDWRYG